MPYALAAACTLEELAQNDAGVSAEDYRRLRAELAELFSLASADFTMENLQSRQFNAHPRRRKRVREWWALIV